MLKADPIRNALMNSERYVKGTSIKTKCLYLRRKILEQFYTLMPRQLWIGVTYRCQCRCVHCCLGPMLNKDRDELNSEEIHQLINNARRRGFLEVSYFGGEPLMRGDIVDLVRYSSSKGLLSSIYTNGILLTRDKVKQLKDAGLVFCNVSLDSALPEQHNNRRSYNECFEKAVEGIKHLVASGIKCSIWTYVNKEDLNENGLSDLKALINLGRNLNVWKVVILFPMASGNWLCGGDNVLTMEERERVRALHTPPFTILEFPSEDTKCKAGKRMVYVSPKGDVSPCPTLPVGYGNIRKEHFNAILNKLNNKFVESDIGGCGECVMNQDKFREHIGVDITTVTKKS